MITILVFTYLFGAICVGIYSSKLVKSSADYALAGRQLSFWLCGSTMFSTWFGSETILGASGEFLEHGILGVVEDPLGTSLGFVLIGAFIARPLYKLDIFTIVDFYRLKFGVVVERVAAILMVFSYIGWIAAQLLAMAIILNVVSSIPIYQGVLVSSFIVGSYTIFGGMWSISINDGIQTAVIVVGLLCLLIFSCTGAAPLEEIFASLPKKHFSVLPSNELRSWSRYILAWLTISLGSIPQQDVFQRILSAKCGTTAVRASYLSSVLYLTVGMIPIILAVIVQHSFPALRLFSVDQRLLQGIMYYDHLGVKVLFFGALLSAIMSSASGAILAPTTILANNVIKPFYRGGVSDDLLLRIMRICVFFTTLVSAIFAMVSDSVYQMVATSSIVSLVSLFFPFIFALYGKKPNPRSAFWSILLGPIVWLSVSLFFGEDHIGALFGFIVSGVCMILGERPWKKLARSYRLLFGESCAS